MPSVITPPFEAGDRTIKIPVHFGEVFWLLERGYHLTLEDAGLYQDVESHPEEYQALFSALGRNMVHDPLGIIYFAGSVKASKNNIHMRYAAFLSILIDWLADQGEDPASAIYHKEFKLEELPHTKKDRYLCLMSKFDITDESSLLKKIVEPMERHGLVSIGDGPVPSFIFRKSIARFVRFFEEIGEESEHDELAEPVLDLEEDEADEEEPLVDYIEDEDE